MSMFRELEKLIPPPGHFLLVDEPRDGDSPAKKDMASDQRLDIFKESQEAKNVYAMYVKSWDNATSLLEEANLLYQHKRYARCVVLGIAAWEELGKSQIAADYYSGVVTRDTYEKAFRDHHLKTSYLVRTMTIGGGAEPGVAISSAVGTALERIRQNALYVSRNSDPGSLFKREDAEFVLQRVQEHKQYIEYAEDFNGRIGSKALFK